MSEELEALETLLDESGEELLEALLSMEPGERLGNDTLYFVRTPEGLELHDQDLGVYVLEPGTAC